MLEVKYQNQNNQLKSSGMLCAYAMIYKRAVTDKN